jgi:hypothetical protein
VLRVVALLVLACAVGCDGGRAPPVSLERPTFACDAPADGFAFSVAPSGNTQWRVNLTSLKDDVATLHLTQPSTGDDMEVSFAVPGVAPVLPDFNELVLMTRADNACDACPHYQRLTDTAGAPYIEGGTVARVDGDGSRVLDTIDVPFDVRDDETAPCVRDDDDSFARARVEATDTIDSYVLAPGEDRVLTLADGLLRIVAIDAFVDGELAAARAYLYRVAQ